jgi:hypothetical protein
MRAQKGLESSHPEQPGRLAARLLTDDPDHSATESANDEYGSRET